MKPAAALVLLVTLAATTRTSPLLDLQDQGRFRILLHGQPVGTEEFRIEPSGAGWLASAQLELRLPDQPVQRARAELTLDATGQPLAYHWQQLQPDRRALEVAFHGSTARLTLHPASGPAAVEEFTLVGRRIVLDNNLYHHFALLARLYDWQLGGPQTFTVLIPQDLTPGTVRVEPQPGAQRGQRLRLRVASPDLTVELELDASHRLLRLSVPEAGAEVVRE
jgi:hypothetical protein